MTPPSTGEVDDATAPNLLDPELKTRALKGAVVTFMKYGGAQAIRLAGNLILTRLLFAEAFGLMALIGVMIQAIEMFSDIGIGPTIVRSSRGDDPVFLDTIWTVQALRGAIVWLVTCAVAYPFAQLYDQPVLAQMIPIVGLNSLISGLTPTKQHTLNRHLRLGKVMIQEIVSQLMATISMILLALVWRSVWTLVIGTMLGALVHVFFSVVLLPGRNNRFCWEAEARRELLGFGRWVFVSTMLTFASHSADRLIFGKLVSLEMLGVFSIGRGLGQVPAEAVGHIALGVIFPYYSRVATAGHALHTVFNEARRPLLVGSGWGLAMLAATGETLVQILYDQRYEAAGWVVQTLAVGAWFNTVWQTNVAGLLAIGASRSMAATTAIKTVAIAIFIPTGYWLAGFTGAVAALTAAEIVQLAVSDALVARQGFAGWWHHLPITALVLASAIVGYLVSSLVPLPHVVKLLVGAAAVTLLWIPIGWPLLRKLRTSGLSWRR